MWIEGGDLSLVKKVIWRLHPTFPDPIRKVDDAARNFRLDTAGWGTFVIRADIFMRDGTSQQISHDLALHYPNGTVTTA